MKLSKYIFFVILFFWSCGDETTNKRDFKPYDYIYTGNNVITPPNSFNPFYKKYLNAGGIPIIASENVSDAALVQTRYIALNMLVKRPDVLGQMVMNKARIAIIADTEKRNDLPEYKGYGDDINAASGISGSLYEPICSFAEKYVMTQDGRPIAVHEIGHLIHSHGLVYIETGFDKKLEDTYSKSIGKGLWKDTYAGTNTYEYWAEGTAAWFDGQTLDSRKGGVVIRTRTELKNYDPELYKLLEEIYPDTNWRIY